MNLREFIARLECEGMPEASEFLVLVNGTPGVLTIEDIEVDTQTKTVWLETGDY